MWTFLKEFTSVILMGTECELWCCIMYNGRNIYIYIFFFFKRLVLLCFVHSLHFKVMWRKLYELHGYFLNADIFIYIYNLMCVMPYMRGIHIFYLILPNTEPVPLFCIQLFCVALLPWNIMYKTFISVGPLCYVCVFVCMHVLARTCHSPRFSLLYTWRFWKIMLLPQE
jgi:hypothetical protein